MESIVNWRTRTAPLGIGVAGTAVHDLQDNWVSISILADSVVGSISLSADQFEAFSARKVVVWVARCTRA